MKIVVRGTNWIGDAVMTIPALQKLRSLFPKAHITLHTRSWAKAIFQDTAFIDEILAFEQGSNALTTVKNQANVWRKENFDLAILFTNSFQTALLSKLGKVKKTFGYRKEGRSFLLTNPITKPLWKGTRHEVFYYLNMISEVEKYYFDREPKIDEKVDVVLKVSDERKKQAREILTKYGVDPEKKTVALGVGSTNSLAKRWHAKGYAELCDKLANNMSLNVVLLGSQNEIDISQEVFEKSKVDPIILTGETNLSEAVSVLSEVDLFISNDMGLAHIAPAVGTKTLVIFGPTDPKTTKPIGSEIVRKELDCAPCMLRECPIDHPCMNEISAEQVFETAQKLMNAQ